MPRKYWGHAIGVAAAVVCLFVSPRAEACSVCGCGDPLVIASDSAPHSGTVRVAMQGEYLTASAASDDNPAATEGVIQTTLRPMFVWSPLSSLNLVLQVPVTRKQWSLTGGDARASADNTGLGDVDIGARWFLLQSSDFSKMRRQEFALSVGTSLPTGPNNAQVDGARIDDHAQLGTGSFGPYVGALYAFHQDPWSLTLNVGARYHTANSFGYQYGPAVLWGVRGTYRLFDWLGLVLGMDGRYATRDTSGNHLQSNTGGLLLAAVPGLTVKIVGELWLLATAQLPVYSHLFGVQTVGPVVSAGLQYAFK